MVQMEVSENSGAVRVIEKVRIIIVILYRKWKLLYRI